MSLNNMYLDNPISLEQTQQLKGSAVLEFGTAWCTHCIAAQTHINEALQQQRCNQQEVQHIKIEDGKGKRLGRSYAIKLWPTLVFLKDGIEVTRVVRPNHAQSIHEALSML